MRKLLSSILKDLSSGQHLETYVYLAVALAVTVFSALGITNVRVALSVLLSGSILTAGSQLASNKRIDRTVATIGRPKTMVVMRDADYLGPLSRATSVRFLCINNYRFLAANSDTIHNFLRSGGHVRELLMDGEDSASLYVATARAFGSSSDGTHTKAQIVLAIDKLRELNLSVSKGGSLEVKKMPYPTAHIMTWFQFRGGPDEIYVVPTGFHQATETRPTLVVDQIVDQEAFNFYVKYFDNMWNWTRCSNIDLMRTGSQG